MKHSFQQKSVFVPVLHYNGTVEAVIDTPFEAFAHFLVKRHWLFSVLMFTEKMLIAHLRESEESQHIECYKTYNIFDFLFLTRAAVVLQAASVFPFLPFLQANMQDLQPVS